MKRTLILMTAVILLSAGVSYAVARWVASHGRSPTEAQVHDAAWLKRELNLTDAQAREVERRSTELQAKVDGFCDSHCAARFALGDELAKPQPDPEKCRAWVEKMNAVQADAEQTTLAHILQVRSLLTPQQAERYSTLVREQVCTLPRVTP